MSLTTCRLCSHICAKEAKKCPSCGVKTPDRETYKIFMILELILGSLMLVLGIYFAFNRDIVSYESETFKIALCATMIVSSLVYMIAIARKLIKS